jgi:hypothetical protein
MIAAVATLVSKEIQQHKGTFFWLVCFSSVTTWSLFRVSDAGGQVLSYLSITSIFAVPVLLIIALVIGQRLVAAEYYGQTQQFIEALPIPAGYVQWVKYYLGLFSLLALIGGVWVVCILAAKPFETITPQFVAFMAVRLCAFVFCAWSLVFTFSLLGRLRIPLMAVTVLVMFLVNSHTQFELNRFGPLALMDRQLFAFERSTLPTDDLVEALLTGVLGLATGMWLARMRDGSLAESLATPVSARAKGFLSALIIATLGIYSYFGPDPEAEPFTFSDRYVANEGPVAVAYLDPQFEVDARQLADYLGERYQALQALAPTTDTDFLVRVSLAPVAEPTKYRTLLTSSTEGVAVSANFERTPGWDNVLFGAYAVHQILYARSDGRLTVEPQHWVLDGFARWWAASAEQSDQSDQSKAALGEQLDPIMLEALYATRHTPINEQILRQWDISSAEFGEYMAMSVAYSGWRVLQEQRGTDAALAFARQQFSRPTFSDARDWWRDWRDPLPQRFARATGWNWQAFVAIWDQRLNELRSTPSYRQALDSIANSELTITPEVGERGSRSLHYRLILDQPLPADTKCAALHTKLPSFDPPVGRSQLREVEVLWPHGTDLQPALSLDYQLVGEYGQGTRVFAAFECQFPQFPAPLYLGSIRLTMP